MRQISRREFEKYGLKIRDYDLKWARPLGISSYNPTHIIVHHDMWPGANLKQIHYDHVRSRGFRGFGYNYRITKDGVIERGRPVGSVTAQCKEDKMNFKSIGIVMEGCYTDYKNITEKEAPKEQMKAAQKLIEILMETHKIKKDNVKKHHDFAPYKDCPGKYFPFEELKESIGKTKEKDKVETKVEEVSPWAKEAWNWAKDIGLNDGAAPKAQVTEEQLMVFFKRFHDLNKG